MTTSPRYENKQRVESFRLKPTLSYTSEAIIRLSPFVNEERMAELSNIILTLKSAFMNHSEVRFSNLFNDYEIQTTDEKFFEWLHDSLFSISDYQNLNLSWAEKQEGITVDDENRAKFNFITMHDKYDENSWQSDFIDLDACIQNIHCSFAKYFEEFRDDCWGCEHQDKEDSICLTCSLNPNFKNHHKEINKPFGDQYSRWCCTSCSDYKAICCYDCDNKNDCNDRCCNSFFTSEDNVSCKGMESC